MITGNSLKRALRGWWIMALGLVLGAGAALVVTSQLSPVYQSTLTFYVVAPASERLTPLQADELVRGRIVAYPGLMTSDQFLERIIASGNLSLTEDEVRSRISASGDSETRTLEVIVRDGDPARSLDIASEIAANFGQLVEDVERAPGSTTPGTSLTAISGPSLISEPVSPRPTLNLAIGALFGTGLGAAIVVMLIRMDSTVRTVDQLAVIDALPLAALPYDADSRKLIPGSEDYASSRLAEAIRGLRTSIQLQSNKTPVRVVAVSSAAVSEGRSTTSIGLAVSLAETIRKVVLVETDLRHPSLAATLKLGQGPGLSDVLQGKVELRSALQRLGDVDVLVAGGGVDRPSALLADDRFSHMLAVLRTEYDFVVLDTPPLRPLTDAALICRTADATVLVTRYGRTTRDDVADGFRILASERCRVLGTVLNMVPGRRPPSMHTTAILSNDWRGGQDRPAVASETDAQHRAYPSPHTSRTS